MQLDNGLQIDKTFLDDFMAAMSAFNSSLGGNQVDMLAGDIQRFSSSLRSFLTAD